MNVKYNFTFLHYFITFFTKEKRRIKYTFFLSVSRVFIVEHTVINSLTKL